MAFALFGMFWGGWAVAAVDVERFLGLSHAGLGVVLAVSIVAGAAVNFVGGPLTERWGTSTGLAVTLVAWGALVIALAATRSRDLFVVLFVITVAAGGGVDVVMNVAATAAMANQPGRLVRFHAWFNGGAVAGAATMGALLQGGASWRWAWFGIGAVSLVLAMVCSGAALPAGGRGEPLSPLDGLAALRRAGLARLAVVFAGAALVEGGIDTWGVLFLRTRVGAGVLLGAGAYVVGQSLATAARAGLGPSASRLGGGRGPMYGAGLAGAGLLVEAIAPTAAPAAIGLATAAVGISVCWPLLIARAGGDAERPGPVVGGVTAVGYLGFVAGPPVIGWLAGLAGLRVALAGLALVAAAVAVASTPARVRA
ncbi:MAG: major facilitator superfamily 1 [Acidimicrobiales bacterium]|nr:major facilitator superfamily 1 [Acidimicrobiales bacterium]